MDIRGYIVSNIYGDAHALHLSISAVFGIKLLINSVKQKNNFS